MFTSDPALPPPFWGSVIPLTFKDTSIVQENCSVIQGQGDSVIQTAHTTTVQFPLNAGTRSTSILPQPYET